MVMATKMLFGASGVTRNDHVRNKATDDCYGFVSFVICTDYDSLAKSGPNTHVDVK